MSTVSLDNSNAVVSGYLRKNASALMDSEELNQYLTRICLKYLYIAIPYRFSNEPHETMFEYSNDAMTVECIDHAPGGMGTHVNMTPCVSDKHPQLSVRWDYVTEGAVILCVTNDKGIELQMSSVGFFTEDFGLGDNRSIVEKYLNFGERKWPDGLRTGRDSHIGEVLSVRILKEAKTIIFGIDEHLREFKNHRVLSADILRFKFKFYGTGNQISVIEYPEKLLYSKKRKFEEGKDRAKKKQRRS